MDIIPELKKVLKKDRENLLLSIERAKEARDKAPSAMESHSDTTRSENEKLVSALEANLRDLEKSIQNLPSDFRSKKDFVDFWNQVKLKVGRSEMTVIFVPDGYGGRKIGEFLTITDKTPLGMAIEKKSVNDRFELNGNTCIIEEII